MGFFSKYEGKMYFKNILLKNTYWATELEDCVKYKVGRVSTMEFTLLLSFYFHLFWPIPLMHSPACIFLVRI